MNVDQCVNHSLPLDAINYIFSSMEVIYGVENMGRYLSMADR
jgi:hypothetical protein